MPHTIANDGQKIFYRTQGATGSWVMLVHGWMTSGAVYGRIVDALCASGYRVIVPDLRGAGKSDRPSTGYTIERYASDVLAVADALGVDHFALVGHSMGGQVAQFLSASAPDRVTAQVLLCPVPAAGLTLPPDALALFSSCAGNAEALRTILTIATLDLADPDRESLVREAEAVSIPCINESLQAWMLGGFADRLADIRTPTLVVATDDPFLPTAFLQEAVVDPIPGARLEKIPGVGHYVQVEAPDATVAMIRSFLG